MGENTALKALPLKDLHIAAGAKFGGFAGWDMPLTYPLGVMKEHLHTREKAGLFDISHMKLFTIEGKQAVEFLNRACPLDASKLAPSQAKYTFFLNEQAGIIDDLIVTRLSDLRFMLVANAGNAEEDEAHMRTIAKGFEVTVTPLDRVFLALQGPRAAEVAKRVGLDMEGLVFMQGKETQKGWFVSRSGYTGEDGFEIGLPLDDARPFAEKLLADADVEWIGLAARDSLRLEAGLCLHGNDITPATDPVNATLLWPIPKEIREGGSFVGAEAFRIIREKGATQKRVGLKADGRQPVRGGTSLVTGDGVHAGAITSGGFGPSADHPVAMGMIAKEYADGATPLFADVRGRRIAISIHPLPFTPHRYFKG
ncbi:glycine cleavage system aminomethyltransferase GcvT [Limoniibacter endophyticus]|uniref:aminomethyltransferase n=1 Tax=Limoniibacter endophyticus TaxID=1565040 RepID=A0A8J3GEG5_9HYPH|nr:glycine cleavage system aminomethyltransferase GcvT [Limoniibacter endophyticus]GHC60264.1 aminomethyltransferase [Limoniibacter endophyticus]